MSALDAALAYAARGWPVFPCAANRRPITEHGFLDATTDPAQITAWWTESPHALIGTPTGARTALAVLDVDMKHGHNGIRTLAGLGYTELPPTPTVLTQTGGWHLHFQRPEGGFGNTAGSRGRGIGDGLDWRGDGGYVILPSPGSGYRWGECNYDNCARLPVPDDLLPREPKSCPFTQAGVAGRLGTSLTANSFAGVVRTVANAPVGERNSAAFWGACRAGEMVAAGLLDADTAIRVIVEAAGRAGLSAREAERTAKSGVEAGSASNG